MKNIPGPVIYYHEINMYSKIKQKWKVVCYECKIIHRNSSFAFTTIFVFVISTDLVINHDIDLNTFGITF